MMIQDLPEWTLGHRQLTAHAGGANARHWGSLADADAAADPAEPALVA
jgi:hypothetical protein